MQQTEDAKFESWAIIEVMGHAQFAGWVTTEVIGGPMIRVDVPESNNRPAFTKYLSPGSIFAITPCTEQTAREAARSFRARPISMFELPMFPRNSEED